MHRHALTILLLASSVCHAQQDTLEQCLDRLADDARFAAIAGKLSLGSAASESPSMRADTALPHEREMKVIADWAAARGECIEAANRSGNPMYRPPIVTIGIDAENKVLAAAAVLHNRKMSYGEFNRQRQAIAEEMRGKIAALSRQIQSQHSDREQADRQARERAKMQKDLEEAERQTSVAQRQASQAQQAPGEVARRAAAAAAGADRAYRPRPPPSAPARPYGR